MDFEDPGIISTGRKQDQIGITIVKPEFFKTLSGKVLSLDLDFEYQIPKQLYVNEVSAEKLESTAKTVAAVFNLFFIVQILL